VKTKSISPNKLGSATAMPTGSSDSAPTHRCEQISMPELNTKNMTTLESNPFTTSEFIDSPMADNPNCLPGAEAAAARRRFLAEHGPSADLPRRQPTSKEFRKALLAAEMAQWEGF
jgi:hypothetical protein